MRHSAEEAHRIVNTLLEQTGTALLARCFDAFAIHFALPHTIETFDAVVTIDNRDDMRARFFKVCDFMRDKGVTDLVRHIIEVKWIDENTIRKSHQSRLLAGMNLIQAPIPNLSDLKRIDGKWKVVHTQYAICDAPQHNHALTGDINSTYTGDTND